MPSEIVLTNDKHYNDIASAIRNKNGLSTLYKPSEMAEAINALVVGGTITLQDKTVNPSEETQTITHDTGYMGLGEVTVTPILTETKTVTENGNVYPSTGKYLTRVTVSVPQGGEINNQNKSVTPTESQQSVTYDDGYTGLGTVTVGAISSTYVGSGITQRSSTDLTASGATVTVPAGYYSEQASKAVVTGSAGTPTATKGTVSNHSISVTPSVTNTTGYITGSTKTGTAVTVSASELVSGKKEITANGDNIDVTNYAQVKVAIPGDTPTIDSLTVTPSESEQTFNSSSVDGYKPVTVGAISSTYVGSGIARNSSTDLTASGATVTVPAGYYAEQETKTIADGALNYPTLSIDNATGKITSVATVQTSGYLAEGTQKTYRYPMSVQERVTITPTESSQIAVEAYKYTLGNVSVAAIPSNYIGSAIDQRDSTDLSASGATVTVPAGYYSEAASKSITSGSATNSGTASASSATITTGTNTITLSKAVSITPTVSAGYISSGTAGSVTVSLTGSVTVDPTPTSSGKTVTTPAGYYTSSTTTDVDTMTLPTSASSSATSGYTSKATISRSTSDQYINIPTGYNTAGGYYKINAVANGSVTAPSSISGTTATVSTGTNTLTLTKTVSVTPNVTTAGYISSGTAGNSSVSLTASVDVDPTPTASGKTVTIPAGYYTESTTKDISTGSATGPSSLSGSSATISTGTNTITLTKTGVTTTPTVSAGYVSSATASTATVALTASVTVNPTPTASGATVTIPAGYYSTQTSKAVSTGSATAPASISGTSATVSTGTNTLTLTKTVSVTPSVSAGYISSGTAGNSSVSLTASVTTKAAATITPGTSDQTISSGTYLTGTQTISGDADLVAGNIKSGVQIFGVTGSYSGLDTSDATASATDIVDGKTAYVDGRKVEGSLVIQKYYTGSSAPSSSLGNNGDIYFQS